ncbi:MAG: ImmA/IrrE family metallo-endopeptidase [Deltaproteobacteria bacterium]|nr:ImmA/IrrE family metallo-endopeptidase [Myxococcales bacterium]MDP3219709.1 ImmA/IrrE family metallo-endopeptidase [Deltaproteobacteria bacterium]
MSKAKPNWRILKDRGLTKPDDILTTLYAFEPPVDVNAIAEHLGVVVHPVPEPGWSGALTVINDHAVAWLHMGEVEERRRFTLAHELGHLMLHDVTKAFRDVSFDGSVQESEANRFAVDLLMPMWMLDPVFHHAKTDAGVDHLAAMFKVSRAAMTRRLHELFHGVIPL